MRKFLINIHQLKTAGKTLEGMLFREYRKNLIYITKLPPHDEQNHISKMIHKINSKEMSNKDAMTGHMFYGAHRLLKNRDFTYTTFLREPIDRAKSYYFYMLNYPDMEISNFLIKEKISLSRFLLLDNEEMLHFGLTQRAIEEINLVINNGQSRVLVDYDKSILDNLYGNVLDNIKKNFSLVGTVEQFNESTLILAKRLNFKKNFFYLISNKNKNKKKFDDYLDKEIIKKFYKNNEVDVSMHSYALQKIISIINNNKKYYFLESKKLETRNNLNKIIRPIIRRIKNFL